MAGSLLLEAIPLPTVARRFASSFGLTFYRVLNSVWPDLAKFHHFGEILKVYGNLMRVSLAFGITLNLLRQIFILLDKFSLVQMTEYWTNKLAIWSHWLWSQKSHQRFDHRVNVNPKSRHKCCCNYLSNNFNLVRKNRKDTLTVLQLNFQI